MSRMLRLILILCFVSSSLAGCGDDEGGGEGDSSFQQWLLETSLKSHYNQDCLNEAEKHDPDATCADSPSASH